MAEHLDVPDADDTPGEPDGVGVELRNLRKSKGISARELAERADVTPSYLSRLETGRLNPTVATLTKITAALGEPVASLFHAPDTPGPVVRRNERRVIRNHGVADELLTPTRTGRLEVLDTVVEPGGGSGDEQYSHGGDEECVVLISGQLVFVIGNDEFLLSEGDAITFACARPHAWHNPCHEPAHALWVITPAGY